MANGYVRGPQDRAAAAWLPTTPASHVEVLEGRCAPRLASALDVPSRRESTHRLEGGWLGDVEGGKCDFARDAELSRAEPS